MNITKTGGGGCKPAKGLNASSGFPVCAETNVLRNRPTLLALLSLCAATAQAEHLPDRSSYRAPQAKLLPIVNGIDDDAVWSDAAWHRLDYRWLGPEYNSEDFSGRYKVAWDPSRIYLLVEFSDDVLIDTHRDPLVQYWDDDCLEIFIDEDHSAGEHRFNHNAFAYHFSLDNRAIDLSSSEQPRDYTHHVQSAWKQYDDRVIWEVSIQIYDAGYDDESSANEPVVLDAGKVMGLMVAYCDNDGSELRENFIGSESVPYGAKDRGYIDAGLFGTLILQ